MKTETIAVLSETDWERKKTASGDYAGGAANLESDEMVAGSDCWSMARASQRNVGTFSD